jgi:hypothetical protein
MPIFLFHSCRKPHLSSINFPGMTFAEFKKKWSRYTGKESSAYQEHFNDLCRLLGQPSLPCRHGALPTLIAKGRRLRRQAEKAHAHETL